MLRYIFKSKLPKNITYSNRKASHFESHLVFRNKKKETKRLR